MPEVGKIEVAFRQRHEDAGGLSQMRCSIYSSYLVIRLGHIVHLGQTLLNTIGSIQKFTLLRTSRGGYLQQVLL
jgi:hypothetical protein